jgi:hypothetical protein
MVFCEAEQTLLLLFWKRRIPLHERFFWGQPQTPWLRFAEKDKEWSSAKQNKRFCFFSGKEEYLQLDERFFWGQPQTPWLRFAEKGGKEWSSAKQNKRFCFFSGKKSICN